jgi:heme exporter protein D
MKVTQSKEIEMGVVAVVVLVLDAVIKTRKNYLKKVGEKE